MDAIRNIALNEIKIRANWNIRTEPVADHINDLVESIKAIGITHPILLNEKLEVVAGHRRLAACKMIGCETISARIKSFPSEEIERLHHIDENLQTKTLSDKDQDKALSERKKIWKKLFPVAPGRKAEDEKRNKTFEKETTEKTGMSESTVRRKILRADESTEAVRSAYETDQIQSGHIDSLVKLPPAFQDIALEKILKNNLSIAETRLMVSDIINKNKTAIVREAAKDFNRKEKEKQKAEDKKEPNDKEEIIERPDLDTKQAEDLKVDLDIDVDKIENTAYTKKLHNHIKALNLIVIKFIKEESWHGVDAQVLEPLKTDFETMAHNLNVLKEVFTTE
jgi:ParB-like chromosome segregation protein Spo0J